MPRPAPHGRPVLSSIKTIASVAAVSDRLAGWHYLRHKFIGAMPQVCHSEERSDVGISQYHVGSWESYRRNRDCLPEIATGAKRPRNDKSGAITVLAIARANRSCSAGPGCPLPYSASSAASRHFPLTLLSPNRGSCRRPLPSRGDFFRAARPSYAAGS